MLAFSSLLIVATTALALAMGSSQDGSTGDGGDGGAGGLGGAGGVGAGLGPPPVHHVPPQDPHVDSVAQYSPGLLHPSGAESQPVQQHNPSAAADVNKAAGMANNEAVRTMTHLGSLQT